MEIKSRNSVTEYSKLKIKLNVFSMLFVSFGVCIFTFLLKECITHILWLSQDKISTNMDSFLLAFFSTILVLSAIVLIGLLVYLTILILSTEAQRRKIRYYKEARFTNIQKVFLTYDYKLWQTAPKNTFHSMALDINVDGEMMQYSSDILFTNNKKIRCFQVPEILQSHSYVKNACWIGLDKEKNQAVILSIEK